MQYRTVSFFPRLRDSFWRHKWLFLLSVLTVCVITVGMVFSRKPTYQASASVQVITSSDETANMLGLGQQTSWLTPSQQNVNRLNDLLNDDRPDGFLDSALKGANLAHPISIDPRFEDRRAAQFRKSLLVTSDSSSLFSLSLTWGDRHECEQILQALMQQYIEEVGNDRQARSIQTMNFLDSQITKLRGSMEEAENRLINYQKNNSGNSPGSQASDQQQLQALKIQRDNLLIQTNVSQSNIASIQQRMKNMNQMTAGEVTYGTSPQELQLRSLQSRKLDLEVNGYLPTSESISKIDEQMHKLMQQIAADRNKAGVVVQTKETSNPAYAQLMAQLNDAVISNKAQQAQLHNLEAQIAMYAARIEKIPEAQRDLTNRTRDYKTISAEYDRLVEDRDKARMKAELERITAVSQLVPVGTIYAQKATSKSKQMMMLAGGIFLGLIIGVAVVVLSEWCDTTLRYGADAERILDIPVLAEVPELKALPLSARATLPGASGTAT